MSTIIIYASKYGSVERCVILLGERIVGGATIVNVHNHKAHHLLQYDNIIIGGSIYMGKIQKEIQDFCKENLEVLLTKNIGLFISSALNHQNEFDQSFPKELIEHSKAKANFGYELNMHKFSALEKIVLKFLPPNYLNNYGIKINNLEKFIKELGLHK